MKRKGFRVGQRIRLVSDPSRTFTIAASRVPDRIYRLKGMEGFFLRKELQAILAPEKIDSSRRLSGLESHARGCAQCAQPTSEGISPEPRQCRECGATFTPKKAWQQFDTTPCRRAWWKRTRKSQARLRVEAREPKVLASTPRDALATVN